MDQRIFKILLLLAVFINAAWMDPFRDRVSEGNREFSGKKYREAKRHYNSADTYAPGEEDKRKLSFNKGDADYMLGDYDSASANFREGLKSEDKKVQSSSLFNLGNTYMKKGDYREAVNAYMNVLRIDPAHRGAKKNIEYILKNRTGESGGGGKDRSGKDGGQRGDDGGRSGKDGKKRGDDGRNAQNRAGRAPVGAGKLDEAQMKNMLDSLKNSPVRRRMGGSDERRQLEKNW